MARALHYDAERRSDLVYVAGQAVPERVEVMPMPTGRPQLGQQRRIEVVF